MKRRALGAAALLAALALGWWTLAGTERQGAAPAPANLGGATAMTGAPGAGLARAVAASAASAGGRATGPFSAAGLAQREQERAAWQQRLQRAQAALEGYRSATVYPHESRPAREHPDQIRPFAPIEEDRALRLPGGSPMQGAHLRTSQERIFLGGDESARITLGLFDDQGRALPLRFTRAELIAYPPPPAGTGPAPRPVQMRDDGQQGDTVAGDGIHSVIVQPARQGFANYAGTVRLELAMESAGQPGVLFFDVVYNPETAARWLPGVREAVEDGSLNLYLRLEVLQPGRYVVAGRVDHADGQPLAVIGFNDELAAGTREIRLPLFGKLLRDERARFPLVLRDVEAFRLAERGFPDRTMLPRLAGTVHTTRSHALAQFSDAEWQSEQRNRYLGELGKDVDEALDRLAKLAP